MEAAVRTEKELIDATRPFAQEDKATSWRKLAGTFGVFALCEVVTWLAWRQYVHLGAEFGADRWSSGATWAALGAMFTSAVLAGLTTVRAFIVYHDYLHGAILRRSKLARALLYTYGIFVMTPPRVWRETHNYHHAHTAKIVGSHVGSYAMVTPAIWAKMSARERLVYKIIRHPLTIAAGYFTIFMYGMCVSPLLRGGRKNWDSALSLAVAIGLNVSLFWAFGPAFWFFMYFAPCAVAMATGSYLFYAQHNFPDIYVQPRDQWSYTRAALESSSYMKTGPVMGWFTGNIGYHHVHHLNPLIPFYRLPEAMAAIPELQNPRTTTLSWADVAKNFTLKIWDPTEERMVGYPAES
jgi:omega-6 fatty acid desaturase (delta-12 desaturase)